VSQLTPSIQYDDQKNWQSIADVTPVHHDLIHHGGSPGQRREGLKSEAEQGYNFTRTELVRLVAPRCDA